MKQLPTDALVKAADTLKLPEVKRPLTKTLDGENAKLVALGDSVSASLADKSKRLPNPERLADSLRQRLQSRIDSLQRLPQPDTLLIAQLKSARAKLESLKTEVTLPQMPASVTDAAVRIQTVADSALSGVNDGINRFAREGANLQGVSGPAIPLPTGAQPILPLTLVNLPASNPNLSAVSIPAINTDLPLPQGAIPQNTLPATPDINSGVDKITGVTGELNRVKDAQKDVKAITSGNLDSLDTKSVESKLAALGDATEGQAEIREAAQQAEMLKKWNSDPMYKQEMALTAAKEGAMNHFAGHEAELLAAMDKLSEAKTKVKDIEQVVDLFSKPANPMKDKPIVERLRPGINFQVQWSQIMLLDINPLVGYRLSGRWTTGIGWNERVGFSSDSYSFSGRDRIYGPRAFVHFKFRESNFLILAPELMHTRVAATAVPPGESTTKWVPGLMAGYRREFRYSKKVIGTVQFLYNVVTPSGQSPYASRFNVMFGFEFPLKKRPNQP